MSRGGFLQEYVEEVKEHLQELESSLLILEREGNDKEEISQIFRAAHSIKGASAYMGFEQLAHLTHELESLISDIQKNSQPVSAKGISLLLGCVDFISRAIGHLEENDEELPIPPALLEGLHGGLSAVEEEPESEPVASSAGSGSEDLATAALSVETHQGATAVDGIIVEERITSLALPVDPDGEGRRAHFEALLQSFRGQFWDMVNLFAFSQEGVLAEADCERADDLLRQMTVSSQQMGYDQILGVLDAWRKAQREAHQRGQRDTQFFSDLLNLYGQHLQEALPVLQLPALAYISEEALALDDGAHEEEDQELLNIYLDSFRQNFVELASLIPPSSDSILSEDDLNRAREVIKRTTASTRYMDYDQVVNILDEMDECLVRTCRDERANRPFYAELIESYGQRFQVAMPALRLPSLDLAAEPAPQADTGILDEEDEELLGIFLDTFQKNFAEIVSLSPSSPGEVLSEADFEHARNFINRSIASSHYMDYDQVVDILKGMDEALLESHRSGQVNGRLYGDLCNACTDRLRRLLPALRLPVISFSLNEEEPEEEDEGHEEEDEELLSIFIETFQQNLLELASLTPSSPEGLLSETDLDRVGQVIKRLLSSARYMDYAQVIDVLEDWEESLTACDPEIASDGSRYAELFNTYEPRLQVIIRTLRQQTLSPVALEEEEPPIYDEDGQRDLPLEAENEVLVSLPSVPEDVIMESEAPAEEMPQSEEPVHTLHVSLFTPLAPAGESPQDEESAHSLHSSLLTPNAPAEESSQHEEPVHTLHSSLLTPHFPVGEAVRPREPEPWIPHEQKTPKPKPVSSSPEEGRTGGTLRVNVQKVDQLLNQVMELVVRRSEFMDASQSFRSILREFAAAGKLSKEDLSRLRNISLKLNESTSSLGRVTTDMQHAVMGVRMLPISQLYQRFPRVVRDQALKLGREVELVVEGEETEIDKRVLEQMYDPIVQCLRNAIAHGIESPEERRLAGKSQQGFIRLSASQEGDFVILEIEDDGRGIDTRKVKRILQGRKEMSAYELEGLSNQELMYAIFLPGVSTQDMVDGSAGRGVGLDVVKENVERLNGSLEVSSQPGVGTRFTIRIPLTVAIIRALLVKGADQVFTLPLNSVAQILKYRAEDVHTIEGFQVIQQHGRTLPLVRLSLLLGLPSSHSQNGGRFIVVVATTFREVGLVVDGLVGEREIVIKPIEDDMHAFEGFSGATILGDGRISLILDVSALLKIMKELPGESAVSNRQYLH